MRLANRKPVSFHYVISLCSGFDATLQLDKVFALVGMIAKERPIDSPTVKLLKPDYNRSVSEVYTVAARTAIIEGGLDLFWVTDDSTRPSRQEEIPPSWVPFLEWDRGDTHRPRTPLWPYVGVAASGSTQLNYQYDPSWGTLSVGGLVVSRIVETSAPLPSPSGNIDGQTGAHKLVSIFVFTLQMLRACEPDLSLAKLQQNVQLVATGGSWHQHPDRLPVDWATFLNWVIEDPAGSGGTPDLYKVRDICNVNILASINRRFFITAAGRLALGHRNAKPEDIVCIIFECRSPVILRPTGNQWKFVGLAYMQGISEGEYMQKIVDEGRLDEERRVFSIR